MLTTCTLFRNSIRLVIFATPENCFVKHKAANMHDKNQIFILFGKKLTITSEMPLNTLRNFHSKVIHAELAYS